MSLNVKLDTKEKFKVLTSQNENITATMTVELSEMLQSHSKSDIPHLILDLRNAKILDADVAQMICEVQRNFYNDGLSFVICEMQEGVISVFEKEDLIDELNYTPTLSEAWDIVQMEEIERELMNGFDD